MRAIQGKCREDAAAIALHFDKLPAMTSSVPGTRSRVDQQAELELFSTFEVRNKDPGCHNSSFSSTSSGRSTRSNSSASSDTCPHSANRNRSSADSELGQLDMDLLAFRREFKDIERRLDDLQMSTWQSYSGWKIPSRSDTNQCNQACTKVQLERRLQSLGHRIQHIRTRRQSLVAKKMFEMHYD